MEALAQPKPDLTIKPKNPFLISRAALNAKPSRRIVELAKPKTDFASTFLKNELKHKRELERKIKLKREEEQDEFHYRITGARRPEYIYELTCIQKCERREYVDDTCKSIYRCQKRWQFRGKSKKNMETEKMKLEQSIQRKYMP